eukprot:TRINITY_DN27737_c1_g1_i1.p1 TRINITY_DN27737_c1_g1~~TRINITY_DN27737_c1_g1_i1.p1  ORF type:complete len:495 (+),score=67.49 TRINITY_DN27737_c1_g1_i1:201-1685(+)
MVLPSRGKPCSPRARLRNGSFKAVKRAVAKENQQEPLSLNDCTSKLRLILPNLWSLHKEGRGKKVLEGKTEFREVASLTLQDVRKWLRSPKAGQALNKWIRKTSDATLRRVLRLVARGRALTRRLGFRFQDPSKSGTWSVENIIGHSKKRVGRLPERRASEVSWHSYWASFRLKISEGSVDGIVIERFFRTKALATKIEKRRPGENGGPLAQELVHVTAHSRRNKAVDRRSKIKVIRRAAHLLPAVIMHPLRTSGLPRWTMIYLHGMGSSALGNYGDRPHYFNDGTAAVKVIVPTAPSREVSCFDSWWSKSKPREQGQGTKWRLTKFFSWYDYTSNHGGRKEDALCIESLHAMQRALHKIIEREAAELGGRTDRIIIGGKSQGCATALDAALTYPKKLGGFIGLVGHLLSCTPVDPDGAQAETPFHFYHEVEDDIMQWHWVKEEQKRLTDAGYKVKSMRCKDPEGTGHFIGGIEGQWIRRSLRQICLKEKQSSS